MQLNVRHGGYYSWAKDVLASNRGRYRSSKFLGPAYTVRMVAADNTLSVRPSKHFANAIPRRSVVFVSPPKEYISACWGGLMSTRAQKAVAAGIVIDGRFGDIAKRRGLEINLFARGMSVLGLHTFTTSSELNVLIYYNQKGLEGESVGINPGDISMGDAEGVVAIPPHLVEGSVKLCDLR